jgi:hypothetical protein
MHRLARTQTYKHQDTHTYKHKHTDAQAYKQRLTNTKTHTRTNTYKHTDAQANKHTDLQTDTYKQTAVQIHKCTKRYTCLHTHRHRDVRTHMHTNTETYGPTHTDTQELTHSVHLAASSFDKVSLRSLIEHSLSRISPSRHKDVLMALSRETYNRRLAPPYPALTRHSPVSCWAMIPHFVDLLLGIRDWYQQSKQRGKWISPWNWKQTTPRV